MPVSRLRHRVPFFDTDAMGVVHHANTVRYLELARVQWLDEHDVPYTAYLEMGINFAVTRVEVDYVESIRFDDVVEVTIWAAWVRGASMRIHYVLKVGDRHVASAATEHAAVDGEGRVRRIPRERRDSLRELAPASAR